MIGTSSSTMVGEPWNSFICRWAKPTTATSLNEVPFSQVGGERVVRRVGLAGRAEVVDVLHRRRPLLAGLPHSLHAHAHPDLVRLAAEDEVEEGDVGALEQDVRRDVGRLDALAQE